jgi:hypothetical protein
MKPARCILGLCVAACFLNVSNAPAATFAPTKGERAAALPRGFKSSLGLTTLSRHIDEQGRTYVEVDDMKFVTKQGTPIDGAFTGNLWTNGAVYYVFDSAVTTVNRQNWRDAAATWSATATLTFTEGFGSGNYIYVQNGSGNNSYVGMIGGQQTMNIASWTYRYIIAHEIGHALGLIHEHQRSDRDSYVSISWNYIQNGYESNFQTFTSTNYGTYDFDSVMHYDKCSFSTDCPPGFTCACTHYTIVVLPPNDAQWQNAIGQRDHLSQLDGSGMAQRYGSSAQNYTITTSSSPSNGGATTGGGTFAAGSSRTVTATANSGFTFNSWTENAAVVSTSASYTFTLNGNRTLVANFATNQVNPPTVQTVTPIFVSNTSTTIKGTVTNDGGAPVSSHYFYYWIDPASPIGIDDSGITTSGNNFSAPLTGLNPNLTYYYRAYAHNSSTADLGSGPGWGYGTVLSFTAKPQVSSVTYSKTNGFTVIWKAKAGLTYQIQRSADPIFASYVTIVSGIAGIEPTTQYVDGSPEAKAATRMYYRVVLQ